MVCRRIRPNIIKPFYEALRNIIHVTKKFRMAINSADGDADNEADVGDEEDVAEAS